MQVVNLLVLWGILL